MKVASLRGEEADVVSILTFLSVETSLVKDVVISNPKAIDTDISHHAYCERDPAEGHTIRDQNRCT